MLFLPLFSSFLSTKILTNLAFISNINQIFTPMDTVLAVFLYLHVLSAPGTYDLSLIESMNTDLNYAIRLVEASSFQMETVIQDFLPKVKDIVIINDEVGYDEH